MTDTITTPFGFTSTAADVVEGIDLTGRRVVVTGGASGIGVETARALVGAGADVTLAVRDIAAGDRTVADIRASTGSDDVRVAHLDLADLDSVHAFAAAWDEQLDVLVNNAGVMAIHELTRSREGWEMQFAVNHLGHFALALGLHDALAAARNARIVSLSSSGHLRCPVVFDDLHFRFRPYEPFQAYAQSKTANVLFAVEATRRWAGDGITVNAVMPGGIHTNLQRHVGGDEYINRIRLQGPGPAIELKTIEQGAATSVLVASSPELEGVGGRYFEDCHEAEVVDERGGPQGVARYAVDPANAERLWDVSLELLRA
jgi:NAD(P)-dependent dehydrogenase (short-subunit alcohol dehydrogenase family)